MATIITLSPDAPKPGLMTPAEVATAFRVDRWGRLAGRLHRGVGRVMAGRGHLIGLI
jgi:hypothetical protein